MTERLRLDPSACDGVGLCAHLAPSLIRVDSWGYPIVSDGPKTAHEERAALSAVIACPRRALFFS